MSKTKNLNALTITQSPSSLLQSTRIVMRQAKPRATVTELQNLLSVA